MVASLLDFLDQEPSKLSTGGLPIIGTISGEPIFLYEDNKEDPLQRKIILETSVIPVSLEALQKFRPYETIKLND